MGAIQERHLEKIAIPSMEDHKMAMINGTNLAFTTVLILVLLGYGLSFFIKSSSHYPIIEEEELEFQL